MTDSSRDEATLVSELLRLVNGSWVAQACYVIARLGIPDLLASGPRSAADLAAATNTNASALHRLLNGLGSVGICRLRDDDTFEMTRLGELLRKDVPSSMRAWTLHWGGESWPVWANLLHSVRTGQSARALITGTPGFSHLDRDPQAAAIFNQAMADLTRLTAIEVARVYDFSQQRVVDVGGGYGELLAQILIAYPTARGVLFDMAHAIDKARDSLAARGFSDRCEFAYGDFFESVPTSADVYVLKSVIHDWPDERARVILQTCRRAMHPKARLLVIERLMPEKLEPGPEAEALARSDLHMLVALGAQERTHAEMHALLSSAGLKPLRTLETASGFQIVESGT